MPTTLGTRFLLTIASTFLAAGAFAQGADECANADDLGVGPTVVNFNTAFCSDTGTFATTSVEQQCDMINDVWFKYTASMDGIATVGTCNNTTLSTRLGVWSGSDCGNLVRLGCGNYFPGCGQTSQMYVGIVAGQTYFVQVGAAGTASPFGHGFLTIVEGPDTCQLSDDMFEDNDTCATATPLSSGVYPDLLCHVGDSDFYRFTLQAGELLHVTLADNIQVGNICDLDLRLFDSTCSLILDVHQDGLRYTNSSGVQQDFILEVYVLPTSAEPCLPYKLRAHVGPDPCLFPVDDGLEENDDCDEAVPIGNGWIEDLFTSKTDWDYYEVLVADGDTLTVLVFFAHAVGDMDIFLYDPPACQPFAAGNVNCQGSLVCGFGVGDYETMEWTNNTGSDASYIIKVNVYPPGLSGDCNFYDMFISGAIDLGPIGASYCGPALPNSTGSAGSLSASGSTAVSHGIVTLTAEQLPPGRFGYFLASRTEGFFVPPGSQGAICLGGNIGRYNRPADIIQGPTGSLRLDLSAIPVNPAAVVVPGDTWRFQCWFRDVNPNPTSNFTDGVVITFS